MRERLEQDPAARLELARFRDVAGALATTVTPRTPAPSVRARILDRVRRNPQPPQPQPAHQPRFQEETATGAVPDTGTATLPAGPEGIRFVLRDAPWLPAPLPGARMKVLSAGPSQSHVVLLIDLPPGTLYPEHDHAGPEEMYILTGDLLSEGRSLGPGDFLHAEPGSHHHELRSEGGCTALMVVPLESVQGMLPA